MSERFAKFEADSQAKLDASQEAERRNEAFLARAEAANDTAQLELYGSQGRTYTDPESGAVIADKDTPITGKLDSIRSNRRFGTTEDERNGAADMYETAILRDVEEDGLPLAQAKLIADLELADIEKRGKLIGKQVSEGKSVAEAQDSVDTMMTRLADRRRAMIIEGGALTMADYDALRDGKDLYPADEASSGDEPAADESSDDEPEAGEEADGTDAETDAERDAGLRVLRGLSGNKLTEEQLEDIFARFRARNRGAEAVSSNDDEAEALQRIDDGESMLDVTQDLSTRVDTGDDLEEIEDEDEDEDDATAEDDAATTVDTRSRTQRALAEARGLWDNRRSPYSYLHARMTNARAARATARAEARANGESSVDRRAAIAGALAAAAVVAAAIYFGRRGEESPYKGGQGGSGGGALPDAAPNEGTLPNDPLRGYELPDDTTGPSQELLDRLKEPFQVGDGSGYILEIKEAAESAGIDMSVEQAEDIHKQMIEEFGNDYIDINGAGDDIYTEGGDVRLAEPGTATWSPEVTARLAALINK